MKSPLFSCRAHTKLCVLVAVMSMEEKVRLFVLAAGFKSNRESVYLGQVPSLFESYVAMGLGLGIPCEFLHNFVPLISEATYLTLHAVNCEHG